MDARLQAIWFLYRSLYGTFRPRRIREGSSCPAAPRPHSSAFGPPPHLRRGTLSLNSSLAAVVQCRQYRCCPSRRSTRHPGSSLHTCTAPSRRPLAALLSSRGLRISGGEKDLAFQWLEKSMNAREGQELTLLAVDPMWNNLHRETRYLRLLRRIGLPDGIPGQHSN